MDAAHFRQKAAEARAMAEFGQDPRLSGLLLEVAMDLDAEADLIEAGLDRERRSAARLPTGRVEARLSPVVAAAEQHIVTLTDLSIGGARLSGWVPWAAGAGVFLELPESGVRLLARIVRVERGTIAVAFDAADDAALRAEQTLYELVLKPRVPPADDRAELLGVPG